MPTHNCNIRTGFQILVPLLLRLLHDQSLGFINDYFFFLGAIAKRLKEKQCSVKIVYNPHGLRLVGGQLEVGVEVMMPDQTMLKKNIGGKLGMNSFRFVLSRGHVYKGSVGFSETVHADHIFYDNVKKFQKLAVRSGCSYIRSMTFS